MPVAQANPTPNGQAHGVPIKDRLGETLTGEPLTQGYKPTLPLWSMGTPDTVPQFYLLRDIELMMIHPVVLSALSYFKGGIAGAEFDITAESGEVGEFAMEQCQRFWDRGVPQVQNGYEYGWIGCENLYSQDEGPMKWTGLLHFSPRDSYLLSQQSRPIGVRIKNIFDQGQRENQEIKRLAGQQQARPLGSVDLWLASDDVPAKGLWYAHNPRYSQYYGQSQLLGAWKPWRRLSWKDAAETVIDTAVYRFGCGGVTIRYPEEDYQAQPGAPATTVDSQGNPRRYARDTARQMAEWYKSGAGIGLPSSKYPQELGGGDKWAAEIPKSTLNVAGLIEYVKYLMDMIRYGIGVPPELLEASETGSGYSGRAIPLDGFMTCQQRLADALLTLFMDQVLRPLVGWNFGKQKFDVKVKNLLETKRKAQGGQSGETPPQQGNMPGPAQGLPGQRDQGGQPTPRAQPLPASQGAASSGGLFSTEALVTDAQRTIARKILELGRRAA